ncbi:unnamed protein product [Blepharisma stoltei]|uniref:Uncharacterized protein n=1 Tax=Blepharisma stoltei TaxID=1481888 RepID=A0AAU9JQQ8_9CILI|nr:unnamed protein product [Blepharisma stoltei]
MQDIESLLYKRQEISPMAPRIPKGPERFSRYYTIKFGSEDESISITKSGRNLHRSLKHVDPIVSSYATSPKSYRIKTPFVKKSIEEAEIKFSPKPPDDSKTNIYRQRGRSIKSSKARRSTVQPEKEENTANLRNLSNIINGMKDMLGNMPNISQILHKSKDISSRAIKSTKKARRSVAQLNDSHDSYNNKSLHGSGKLSTSFVNSKLSKKIMQNLKSRYSTQKPRRKKSPSSRSGSKGKASVDVEALQNYFLDFHAKSKMLLGNLERNVLGENNICK